MTNEHSKFKDINEIKRKQNKISLLTKQLDIRDLYINNANEELYKNNIAFNYNDPNFVTKDEIEMEPINPENMKFSPSYKSFKEINKNRNINTNKSNLDINKNVNNIIPNSEQKNLSKLKNSNRNDRLNAINKFRNYVNNIVKEDNNNNKDSKPSINNYKRNIDLNKKGNTLINAGEIAIKNNYVNRSYKQNYIIEDNSNINNEQPLLQNLMLQKREKTNQNYKYGNYNNSSFYNKKNQLQETNTSRLENEVQKKVKTILKKDFIGRYKRSPYLRLLNE